MQPVAKKRKRARRPAWLRRSLHVLVVAQAGFEVTGNPIFAWHAIRHCLTDGRELPDWVRQYLVDAAGGIIGAASPSEISAKVYRVRAAEMWVKPDAEQDKPAASRDDKLSGEEKLRRAERALRLRRPGAGNIFDQYAETLKNMHAADTFSTLGALDDVAEKTMIAGVEKMGARTARRRLAEGRAILRRAREIAESGG